MSFKGDYDFHRERVEKIFHRFCGLPPWKIRKVVEREGASSGNTFVEFWERGKPANTGLLLTSAEYWVVLMEESVFAVPVERLRKWCYGLRPDKQDVTRDRYRAPFFIKGGDDMAFLGITVPLSVLWRIATRTLTPDEQRWIVEETDRYIKMPPPEPPPRDNLQLFEASDAA